MKLQLTSAIALASAASASWTQNINYHSPSEHHPSLGISIHKVVKRNDLKSPWDPVKLNLTRGVASGDPYPNSVILWTRVGPSSDNGKSNVTVEGTAPLYSHETGEYVAASKAPVCVEYKVYKDKKLGNVVDSVKIYTSSDIDYTVKVEAKNLKPYTKYYYQFNVCNSNNKSPAGRTKTTPNADDGVTKVGIAIYSGSNYPFGFFNAYGNTVRKDSVDYVFPWIPVWDDHEVADNTYRDGMSELNNTEQSFVHNGGVAVGQHKMNAVRAYFEWIPIPQRTFSIGKLIGLVMPDTHQYDRSITDLYWNTDYIHEISNDAWDGYMSNKNRTLQHLYNNNINNNNNNIFLSGDSHASWVSDLMWLENKPYDPTTGAGSIGVEFGGSAVTSPCPYGANISLATANNYSAILQTANPELQWQGLYYRGYYEPHLSKKEMSANYFGMPTVVNRDGWEISLAKFTVKAGANKLQRPVAGGKVESGSLKGGKTVQANATADTGSGKWFVSHEKLEVL
ncbi:hypothetical protein P154DRAFT_555313 [Amniculicola lignicola CBS 123094]|uniref:PhoD-like phosphatase metallophosphatase domain-containing protein n=1 Tax=Amniculicola lignicola CBS 123094 TaxID=1392246 RepID=A0A6A5WC81_9PLEO|nr:hypothetical protein P154DRAFT_555313 [Amniculicola lignicola CBS 123094]